MADSMPAATLLDIEGTIGDAAFVKNVLFPYARRALPGFIAENADRPDVAEQLAAAAELAGVDPADPDAVVQALLRWIDEDRKATPLKALQGMVWKRGYAEGDFTAHLYPDAYQWMKNARARGVPMYVYSSGSVAAQKLYFSHSDHGDIADWFAGFFDTTIGTKTEPDSYRSIASRIDRDADRITFYSDVEAELDAAEAAGLDTVQIVRPGTAPGSRHRRHSDFSQIEPRTETRSESNPP